MTEFVWSSYSMALPEIFLATFALFLLMLGVFAPANTAANIVQRTTSVGILITLGLVTVLWSGYAEMAVPRVEGGIFELSAMYLSDTFSTVCKMLILLFGFFAVLLGKDYLERHKIHAFEFYILLVLSLLGMMIMVSAADFLMLYIGLEMMSFSLYILAAFNRENEKSSEAGLKYFILGSLASGILLYGVSLLYGLTGTTSFHGVDIILKEIAANEGLQMFEAVTLVMLMTGLAFKISAAPFHMWTPDVYQGAPTPVTGFMAVSPKIAAFALLISVIFGPLDVLQEQWMQVLMVLSVASMALGTLMATVQSDLKRLMAFSSIGHVGFMLVGLSVGTLQGVSSVLFYLLAYAAMSMGVFTVLLMLRKRDVFVEKVSDLAGLNNHSPLLALLLLIFMFSLAGIPPFAGFFAKLLAFKAAVEAGYVWLALVGVLFSVVAAYYCLRVIKTVYFDKPVKNMTLSPDIPMSLWFVAWAMASITVLIIFFVDDLTALFDLASATFEVI